MTELADLLRMRSELTRLREENEAKAAEVERLTKERERAEKAERERDEWAEAKRQVERDHYEMPWSVNQAAQERMKRESAEATIATLNARLEEAVKADAKRQLTEHWHSFCDADPFPDSDTFAERMEAAGLIELVPVTTEALEEAFAAERGIEPGGSMWSLTAAGRATLTKLRSPS
ncbi:MAG: hypothetical protein AB7I42_25160 [Bradyrhizobium sp.]|uniref:hypothetical protein n=1 Tax=Bradyrhizobium sp. TaxID=376 RepID=UPI003D14A0D0